MNVNGVLNDHKIDPLVFQTAKPFPHIIIDNFLLESLAEAALNSFPKVEEYWYKYDNHFEKKRALDDIRIMPPTIADLFLYFNSLPFISFLENLTGISGLIGDPWLRGGGLHQIKREGKLDIHADFNFHQKLGLHRRLNVLIYLNKGWKKEWNGQLELWDQKMEKRRVSVDPLFNRMVCFATTDTSYHGHPEPLMCPHEVTRKSLALYYYTATRPKEELSKPHSTCFKKRPNEETSEEIEHMRELRNKGRLK